MANQQDYNAVVKTVIQASPREVWDGITNPEIVKQYMHGANVKTDWHESIPSHQGRLFDHREFESLMLSQ